MTHGTIEADKRNRRRRPGLGTVVADIDAVRQSIVCVRRATNEPELVDPISRVLTGGLELLGKQGRQNLKYSERHQFRAGRAVQEIVARARRMRIDPPRFCEYQGDGAE